MRFTLPLLPICLLAACGGAKITAFDVTPRRICAGTPVSITFKVKGDPHLTVSRRGGAGADTTTYTIVATTAKDTAHSSMDVITFSGEQILAFSTDMLGHDSLTAGDSLAADAWSGLQVASVQPDSSRALVVRHAGKEATLAPGQPASDAWKGLPVAGRWEIHAPLLHGEIPGNAAHHPPAHLLLTIGLACTGSPA